MFLLSLTFSYGQNKVVDEIINKVNLFTKGLPVEKNYLHTDQSYYGAGETIWFQSYSTAGAKNLPSTLSQTVYVQLINSKDSLIDQVVIQSINGFGTGYLDLPPRLEPGNYQLVSFTNWMKNLGQDYFFRKEIRIVSEIGDAEPGTLNNQNIDLQFFPESGNLINQIPTKIAFKATDERGKGIALQGKVTGSDNSEMEFKTEHDGMGYLFMTPDLGTTYSAKVDGVDQSFPLPEVLSEGYSLRVNKTESDTLKITVLKNGSLNQGNPFQLLIHQRGDVLLTVEVNQKGNISIVEVPTIDFPSGVASITLFDSNQTPLAERLVFIENSFSDVSLTPSKSEYGIRDKVDLDISLNDNSIDTLAGVFSLSVLDLNQSLELEPERTIMTELLLSSDLRGHIDSPSYYFNQENTNRKEHLDLVMLTNGWRRFIWKDMLKESAPPIDYTIEKGVQLKGKIIRELSNNKAESNASVSLLNPAKGVVLESKTDRDGQFIFEDLEFFEGEEVILKTERQKGKKTNVSYIIDSSLYRTGYNPIFEKKSQKLETGFYLLSKQNRDKIDSAYAYLFDSTAIMLADFVLEDERIVTEETKLRRTTFGQGSDAVDFDDPMFLGQFDPIGALRGKFPGVDITGSAGSYSVSIRQAGRISPSPPLFLLDDVPVSMDLINSMSIDQIEKVVVFKGLSGPAVIFGQDGVGGVLAFYTKRGEDMPPRDLPNTGVITTKVPDSYQNYREFYAPKYDVKKQEHIKPDQRILLHWQPMLELSNKDQQHIEFWTSDLETTLLVNIQGLTYSGEPISKYIYIDVVKN